MTAFLFAVFFLLQAFIPSAQAQNQTVSPWDPPKKVDENTVFFGEKERTSPEERLEPQKSEKSYAWRLLELGNNFLLAGHLEKAEAAFAKCYEVGGPTRVLSGFKLVETRQALGRWDDALSALDDMKQKYLASTKEFGEAARIRAEIEDAKRNQAAAKKPPALTGREWLLWVQPERMKFVLEGMEVLRAHGVPLREPAQKYAFRLDEYFIAHPESPAGNPAEALAVIIYETDEDARLPIDRWRRDPSWVPDPAEAAAKEKKAGLSGAEWIRLTHNEKMDYILSAMEVLKGQNVPMKKSVYAYVYAADELFTKKPELSASDSVVTLASILYGAEPDAREVLEALRFK